MPTRLVPAAQELVNQVTESGRKFKVVRGEPDGLGRIRSVTFDARTSRWLGPILVAISDSRIRSMSTNGKGQTTVLFVADYRADFKDPFPIDAVDDILND
jgi:hypothetical protein